MTQKDLNKTVIEDFQRAFKYSRFEERKPFDEARLSAIETIVSLHKGSMHDYLEEIDFGLRDLCLNNRELWHQSDIRPDDNRWFQYFDKIDSVLRD
nr:hypothetical protein 3 [bacterium]